jgi:hypothetical protein
MLMMMINNNNNNNNNKGNHEVRELQETAILDTLTHTSESANVKVQ